MKPRQFDLLAFDWDGTLFDSTALITRCIQDACVDLGLARPSDRDASYVIGLGLIDALRHAAPGLEPDRYPELGKRYRHHYLARQDDLSLFDGVLPMLAALKERGFKLAVATGKTRAGLDHLLDTRELRGLFDATRTADQTRGKPDPLMLLELVEELGTTAERCLMIGDTTHDLQMAVNAGTACLAVSYGAHEPDAFHAYPTRHVAHTVDDLAAWLLNHG